LTLTETVAAIAAATGWPPGRIRKAAYRLQGAGNIPVASSRWDIPHLSSTEVALIVLALLSDEQRPSGPEAAHTLADYRNGDGTRLVDLIAGLIGRIAQHDLTAIALAEKATLSVLSIPAAQFTVDGHSSDFTPLQGVPIDLCKAGVAVTSSVLPGRALLTIAGVA
jgi:hypothetical protein